MKQRKRIKKICYLVKYTMILKMGAPHTNCHLAMMKASTGRKIFQMVQMIHFSFPYIYRHILFGFTLAKIDAARFSYLLFFKLV